MTCKLIHWKGEYKTYFLLSLRDFELAKVILFADDLTTPILNFMTSLLSLQVNISRYQDYYWKIKNLLTGYVNCCHNLTEQVLTIGETILELDKSQFLNYFSKTRNWQIKKQRKFNEEIDLQDILDTQKENTTIKFEEFLKDLDEIEAKVNKFDRVDPYRYFLQEHYEATLLWLDELYEYAADHIAFIIHKESKLVKASIEENYNIHLNNEKIIKEEHAYFLHGLQLDVYEKKKILLQLSRDTYATKQEIEEAEKLVKTAEKNFQDFQTADKSSGLQEVEREREYFENCFQSFEEICKKVQEVEEVCQEIDDMKHQATEMYDKKRDNTKQNENLNEDVKQVELDFLDSKWNEFTDEFSLQSKYFQAKLSNTKKSLITFFFIKGQTRTMCLDEIGKFYLDEYGRQIYSKNFGMKEYNVDTDGALKRLRQGTKYAYDDNGRYTVHFSMLNYERALNSSHYEINQMDLMNNVQKESEKLKTEGKELNYNEVTTLPKGSLSREDVNYLWDALDPILSKTMHDVDKIQSTNHVFNLAHRLITLKYGSDDEQLQSGKEEAIKYREKIYADRQEAKIRAIETWKSQLMKKPRPKDFEDDHSSPIYFNIKNRCLRIAYNNLN